MNKFILAILLAASTSWAQVYVWTNELGDVQYSGSRSDVEGRYAFATSAVAPTIITQPVPQMFDRGLEAPFIVLQSHTNDWGVGIVATDDGDILTYIDHQSPRPAPEVISARIAAERQARQQLRKDAKDNRTSAVALIDNLTTNAAFNAAQRKLIKDLAQLLRDNAAIDRKQMKDTTP